MKKLKNKSAAVVNSGSVKVVLAPHPLAPKKHRPANGEAVEVDHLDDDPVIVEKQQHVLPTTVVTDGVVQTQS